MIAPTTQTQSPSGTKNKSLFTTADGKNYAFVFFMVTLLFLLWGVCNGMIDILNKHFQDSLHINKMQSAFVQFANYMGYFFMAIPSGLLARRYGYKGAILIGLFLVALGAFWFIPATHIGTYWSFLLGLFILATGLTCLETVANPYATVLGPPESGAVRINFAQSGNGVGWMIGPILGGQFVLSSTSVANTSNADLYKPYLIVGIVVSLLFLGFLITNVPDLHNMEETKTAGTGKTSAIVKPLYLRWHFILAVAAQFFYVAAQTGVFSYFVNFINSDTPALPAGTARELPATWTALMKDGTWHVTDQGASKLLSYGAFGLFLLGRFTGSFALRHFKGYWMLATYAILSLACMMLVMLPLGWISVIALFASFFFMSIMYPTIFALGIHGLGEQTKTAASIIVMSIVGGAIMPLFMGWLADQWGMRTGFLMPLLCFAFIAFYGLVWVKLEAKDSEIAA
jgi:FHS family L-fucose permease-like MFS transporter